MTEAVSNVNAVVWPFAIILIAFVIIQATIFLRMALKFNKENKVVSDGDIKTAMKTGGISVIPPAFSVLVVALSLIAMIGPSSTFMRVGVIGSASYELILAQIAADTLGVQLGSQGFTEGIFVLALFGMILGSAPYFINCFLTLKPMDRAIAKSATKKNSFMPALALASAMGIIGYSGMGQLMKGIPYVAAFVAGGAAAMITTSYIKKSGKKGLSDWVLAIGLIFGMVAAMIVKSILGI